MAFRFISRKKNKDDGQAYIVYCIQCIGLHVNVNYIAKFEDAVVARCINKKATKYF